MDLPDASGCLAGCDCILAPAAAPDEARAAAAACPVWVHAYDVGHAHIVQALDEPLRDLLGAGGVLFGMIPIVHRSVLLADSIGHWRPWRS